MTRAETGGGHNDYSGIQTDVHNTVPIPTDVRPRKAVVRIPGQRSHTRLREGQSATAKEKDTKIAKIARQDSTTFETWTPDDPQPEIPRSVLRYLIVPQLLAAAGDPSRVDVVVARNDQKDTHLFILEHTDREVTNLTSLLTYQRARDEFFAGRRPTSPPRPSDVDPMHISNLYYLLKQPLFTTWDRILLAVDFERVAPDHLHMGIYADRKDLHHKGVATDFYGRLHELARKIGIKYISGKNLDRNIGFFLKQLGRVQLMDIEEDLQTQLRNNLRQIPSPHYPFITVATL